MKTLEQWASEPTEVQRNNKEKIVKLFKKFWNQHPTERQFADATGGLVIFSEIMYYMVTK